MKPSTYIVHGVKYFIRLLMLLALLYLLMLLFGRNEMSAEQFLSGLFSSTRGILLFVALFVLAMLYPLFGFVKRTVAADITADREEIIKAFHASGYILKEIREGERMVFRTSSIFKKITTAWDDKITVTAAEEGILLEGIRKETVQAEFRINTFMLRKRNEKEE